MQINDSSPEVFRIVLRYVYGGDASELVGRLTSKIKDARDIIEAADRYGVVGLKLAMETALVDGLVINLNNVVDWILFADAKTCPLLKEYATSYFSAVAKDIFKDKESKAIGGIDCVHVKQS